MGVTHLLLTACVPVPLYVRVYGQCIDTMHAWVLKSKWCGGRQHGGAALDGFDHRTGRRLRDTAGRLLAACTCLFMQHVGLLGGGGGGYVGLPGGCVHMMTLGSIQISSLLSVARTRPARIRSKLPVVTCVGQRILISYAFRDARLHFWPAPGYIHTSNMHVFYVRAINTTPRGPTSNRLAVILLRLFQWSSDCISLPLTLRQFSLSISTTGKRRMSVGLNI
jgi:hypothetical protein